MGAPLGQELQAPQGQVKELTVLLVWLLAVQPGARHHLRNIDHHLHCQRTWHFSIVFHWSPTPKNTAREVLLSYLLTDKLKLRQISCWSHSLQMTEGSKSGAMMPEPHSQRPQSIAEQWLFRLLGLWVTVGSVYYILTEVFNTDMK